MNIASTAGQQLLRKYGLPDLRLADGHLVSSLMIAHAVRRVRAAMRIPNLPDQLRQAGYSYWECQKLLAYLSGQEESCLAC